MKQIHAWNHKTIYQSLFTTQTWDFTASSCGFAATWTQRRLSDWTTFEEAAAMMLTTGTFKTRVRPRSSACQRKSSGRNLTRPHHIHMFADHANEWLKCERLCFLPEKRCLNQQQNSTLQTQAFNWSLYSNTYLRSRHCFFPIYSFLHSFFPVPVVNQTVQLQQQ